MTDEWASGLIADDGTVQVRHHRNYRGEVMTDQPAKKPVRKRATKKAADKPVPVLDTRPSILDQIKEELGAAVAIAEREKTANATAYRTSSLVAHDRAVHYWDGRGDALREILNRITELEKEK